MSDPRDPPAVHVLIPCAGSGSRAGAAGPKQYAPLAGQPLVRHTLAAFAALPWPGRHLVVVAPGDDGRHLAGAGFEVADCGGDSRAASVLAGLRWLLGPGGAQTDDWVLVHDAARCLVTAADIERLVRAGLDDEVGALLALPLPDTLKRGQQGRATETIDRADKWLAQTPQMARVDELAAALQAAQRDGFAGITDEASALEARGRSLRLVPGSVRNFKVTYPEDFALAEALLGSQS
jgi:2-C-methyl-D-erythritol 4-phosphate cytidylyltransferase